MTFYNKYENYKNLFEIELEKALSKINSSNNTLLDAVKYSVNAGGKRIRPVIALAVADAISVSLDRVMPFALALEFIHTYSLIHDDLPAMDNDDYRRGKLTNHKVYGEAMAILAGDALLNLAYETLLKGINSQGGLSAARMIALYAGAFGMIGGQATDITSDKFEQNEDLLYNIHLNKTGRLLTAATLIPSCLNDNIYFENLAEYGKNLGLLFQVTDDILDCVSSKEKLGKSTHKDENSNKLTFVSLYGLDGAKQMADKYYNLALSSIALIDDGDFLKEILDFVKNRQN